MLYICCWLMRLLTANQWTHQSPKSASLFLVFNLIIVFRINATPSNFILFWLSPSTNVLGSTKWNLVNFNLNLLQYLFISTKCTVYNHTWQIWSGHQQSFQHLLHISFQRKSLSNTSSKSEGNNSNSTKYLIRKLL